MGDAFYDSDFFDFAPNTPLLGTFEELERDVNAGQNSVQTPPDLAQSIVANQLQHQPPVHWQHVEQYGGARLRPASSSNLNAQAEVFTPRTRRTGEANRAFDTPVYNGTYDALPALGTAQWQSSMVPAQPATSFMPFVTPPLSHSSHHHTASSSQPSALGSQVHVSPPMLGPGYITPQSSVSGALPQDLVNMLPQELSYTTQAAPVPGMNVQLAPQSPDWRRGFQQQNAGSQSPSFQRQIRRLNVPGNPVGPSFLPPAGPDIDIWNQTQYQPGDYTSAFTGSNSTAPQRPTTANRRRSRAGSQAASTSRSFGLHACDFDGCNRSYSNRADLDHHQRWHGPRKCVCTICNAAFVARKDLTRHVKTAHSEERHFLCTFAGCEYCLKGFKRKDHLTRHQLTHSTPSSSQPMSRVSSRR